jgi:hypothetical protein
MFVGVWFSVVESIIVTVKKKKKKKKKIRFWKEIGVSSEESVREGVAKWK